MRTRIGATVTVMTFLLLVAGAFGVLIADHERPPEEELTALPSLDPEDRDELWGFLAVVRQYYRYKYWEAMADELSDDYREGRAFLFVRMWKSELRRSTPRRADLFAFPFTPNTIPACLMPFGGCSKRTPWTGASESGAFA